MKYSVLQQGQKSLIESLSYDLGDLVIGVRLDEHKVIVTFNSPVAFRCMDEGDLIEYWHQSEITKAWLVQIMSEGWIDKEVSLNGLFSARSIEGLTEFLVTGSNECVSVLTTEQSQVLFE